ncbi:ankyrin repeat protein [Elysia marginata]|uniref:Ankyrin repeat protein n=1 Tax=Elysia marginata TaxID=1093978 RepID=A0AAV4JZU8_9GAST|nr:ankyrin repeat protein [Elysia marginata]
MVRDKGKALKHKMASTDTERLTRSKKALQTLSDDNWLITAIENCEILTVKNILENKDLKISKSGLNAALLKAANGGKKQIVQLLLCNNRIKGSENSKTGSLALVAAAEHGYLDIVRRLIKTGAPVNGKNSDGKTALMAAVERSCSSALISFLLNDCKADINLQDNTGKTALMLAVEQWDYETVQTLFMNKHCNCMENIKDKDGYTALDLAKKNGSAELFDIFSQSCKEQMSPLSLVAGKNNFDLACQLIHMYPSCVESLEVGASPLTAAMHGLCGNQNEWDGKIHCSLELIDLLIKSGVDVNKDHACGLTPLMFAASAGSEKAVQILLRHGADVHHLSCEKIGDKFKRRTALMIAAKNGFVRIVEMLIEAGSDMYATTHLSENALDLAIKGGHKACIRTLLKRWKVLHSDDIELMEENRVLDVLLDVKDRWAQLFKNTFQAHQLLCKAIQARSHHLVMALVDYGININWSYTSSPLFLALDDMDMLHLLLNAGADINTQLQPSGCTALMQAANENNVLLIHTLLKYKANMYLEADGATALTSACYNNKTEAVMALLDGGMDVNHITQTKLTALWCALGAKNLPLTEMLIKRGASVNFAGTNGLTVLMYAIKYCTSNFSELLIQSGADVNAQDNRGETALFHALRHSITREEKVALLLQHGADVNHINLLTVTPLMIAARFCLANVLKVFLSSKPNVNAQDINGNTALHVAVHYLDNNNEKIKTLVSHGAKVNVVNGDYESPLLLAIKHRDTNLVKCLLSLGANLDFKDSPYERQMWNVELDELLLRYYTYDSDSEYLVEFVDCMEALLEAGCSLHGAQLSNLDAFLGMSIMFSRSKIVRLLLQSGIGPNLLDLTGLPESFPENFIIRAVTVCNSNVSPLSTAILLGRPEIIALFSQACFFHQGDSKTLQRRRIRGELEELFQDWPHKNSFSVQELYPENWSLRTWSKLAVLRAVGFGESKEDRVRALPIPKRLQDELLCKNISVFNESAEVAPQNRYREANLGLDDRD